MLLGSREYLQSLVGYYKVFITIKYKVRSRDIFRTFPVALDVGCGRGHISKMIDKVIV